RMFKLERQGRDPTCINYGDFVNILNDFTTPKKVIEQFYYIPHFELTKESYSQFTEVNIPKYFEEKDFLLKKKFMFREKNSAEAQGDAKSSSSTKTTTVKTSSSTKTTKS